MYKLLAILNGSLIAIMIILNGLLTDKTNVIVSTAIINVIGLILIIILILIKKIKLKSLKQIPFYLFFTGVLSVINVGLNSISFIKLGAALTIGLILYGQLLASTLVDHFGILEMNKCALHPKKIIGLAIMSIGILIMIVF